MPGLHVVCASSLLKVEQKRKSASFAGLTVVICRSSNCMRPGFA